MVIVVDISLTDKQPLDSTSDTIVAFDFEGTPYVVKHFEKSAKLGEQVNALISSGDFQGRDGQISVVYTFGAAKPKRALLVGLGKKDAFHLNKVRIAAAQAVNYSRQIGVEELAFPVFGKYLGLSEQDIVMAIIESAIMAEHKFDVYKSEKQPVKLKRVKIAAGKPDGNLQAAAGYAVTVAENCCKARDLINTPASVATPEYVADKAAELCKAQKELKCAVYGKKELQKIKAEGILAVAAGSGNEPRMVVIEYAPKNAKKAYALVGKGITFDSGGLDIKPAASMETMKLDMSGAAAVLFTVLSAAELKLPVKVIGIMALAENMPGSNAYKPGDIIRTMSGKTIEVLNTDAEGRVVLSDALHYAKSYKPDFIVDIATLTGACVVALGSEASGIVGNDAELLQKIKAAGDRTFERAWELPFYEEYQEYIKSDFADL
ncbi:leucyl aminopeptidase, partial [Candidatus Woesearchaeota archaeon]|nr:leucyl aminopeptidase [Candidatus Woesearchaeota archaeon]